jgi:hypothetical protein
MIDLLNKEFTISQMSLRFQRERERDRVCVCERKRERKHVVNYTLRIKQNTSRNYAEARSFVNKTPEILQPFRQA